MSSPGNNTGSNSMKRADLRFVGEITASVTHELSNVLGTIDQVNGLVTDLSESPEVIAAGLSERLLSVSQRITKQADRGTLLIKRLNAFAHLGDHDVAACDIGALIATVAGLTQRLADLQRVELLVHPPDSEIVVTTDPFLLAQTIFRALKWALECAKPRSTIDLRLSRQEDGGRIRIECHVAEGTVELPPPALEELARRVPAEVEEHVEGEHLHLAVLVSSRA